MKLKSICFVERKKREGFNSIEELFSTIILELSKIINVEKQQLSKSGASLNTIFHNIQKFDANADVYHITGDVHYMALAPRKNMILTIHDVKSALHGNRLKQLYIKIFWFWLPVLFAKRVTVISSFTKTELEQLVPFGKRKMKVIFNPSSEKLNFTPLKFNILKPLVLFIGTKVNKNLNRSFLALKDLPVKALIIGQLSLAQKKILKDYKIEYENKYNLHYDDIIQCYVKCDLVCFASTYEGFGMPIIEAQSVGRPVITSNLCSMPEVAGEGALFVDPFKIDQIREGIVKICNDENLRNQLIAHGLENVKRFQVKNIAKQYFELYKEMV